jgi:hypothetical protein
MNGRLIERFSKAQSVPREHAGAEHGHSGELRPKHIHTHAFKKHRANDNQKIAQRVNPRDPLQNLRHGGNGEGREADHLYQSERADHTGNEQPAIIDPFVESGAFLQRDR